MVYFGGQNTYYSGTWTLWVRACRVSGPIVINIKPGRRLAILFVVFELETMALKPRGLGLQNPDLYHTINNNRQSNAPNTDMWKAETLDTIAIRDEEDATSNHARLMHWR